MLTNALGDDSTPQAGVTTDDSGMSVVTVVGSQTSSSYMWVLLGIALYWLYASSKEDE